MSGDFERVILQNIRARAHFVVLPPEKQAFMLLQAKKQREELITAILPNLQRMREKP